MKPQSVFAWIVSLSVLLVLGLPATSFAQNTINNPDFFNSSQIRPGLRGFTKICFNGGEIHKIEVEVISLLGQRAPESPKNYYGFIARISGPIIDITHGISEGASGAPVYFDGKLAGSINGLVDYDYGSHDLISCRTIEESIKLFDYPSFKPEVKEIDVPKVEKDNKPAEKAQSNLNIKLALNPVINIAGRTISALTFGDSTTPDCLKIKTCSKIVRVGKKDDYYDPFVPWWKRYKNLALAPTYNTQMLPIEKQLQPIPVQPGSPIAIVLVKGDVNWVEIGTLTYIAPDGKFLAFGHDVFDRSGSINVPVASAHYLTTITNMNRFITMAQSENIIGSILEDRREGVAGKLGSWNGKWIPISLKTHQVSENRGLTLNFEIPQTPEIAWDAMRTVVSYAAMRSIDNFGELSLESKINLSLDTKTPKVISYRNCYTNSPLWQMLDDLNQISVRLELNDRELVLPAKLEIDINTVQGRQSARITDVELLNDKNEPLKPKDTGVFTVTKGEDLKVKVFLQYYNGKSSEAVHTIKWPGDDKKFGIGSLTLQVFGGGGLTPFWGDTAPQVLRQNDGNRMRFINVKEIAAPTNIEEVFNNLLPDYQNDNLVMQLINTNNDLRSNSGEMANNVTVLVPRINNLINGFKRFDLEVIAPPATKTPVTSPSKK